MSGTNKILYHVIINFYNKYFASFCSWTYIDILNLIKNVIYFHFFILLLSLPLVTRMVNINSALGHQVRSYGIISVIMLLIGIVYPSLLSKHYVLRLWLVAMCCWLGQFKLLKSGHLNRSNQYRLETQLTPIGASWFFV